MHKLVVSSRIVAALSILCADLRAQAEPASRIHWYLEQQLDQAQPNDRLPVYFVMADRLGYEHWFPRVNRLHVDERRMLVVAELKAYAEYTQADLIQKLRERETDGSVSGIRSVWLGNFIKCDASPYAVRQLARMPGLEEVRYDASWPLNLVEDSAPAVQGGMSSNGPMNTKADQVWAMGFTGQGVLAMNVDTVAAINHGDLVNRKWFNEGEIANNGIDDDNNGYIDDINGYNFFDNTANVSGPGSTSHGTHTAGAMVADGACSGVITGQAPDAKVMFGAVGACCPQNGPVNRAGEVAQWEAIQYGIDNGAHVQTSSHSYKNGFIPPPNYKMHRTVADNSLAAGLIRCNSTSNNGNEANNPTHLARIPFNVSTPGNIPSPYLDHNQTLVGGKSGVIGVGAHNVNNNQLERYSPRGPFAWHIDDMLAVNPSYPLANWSSAHNDYPWFNATMQGLLKPDLTGPTNTLSVTGTACGLGPISGTSNATPRVAGTMILWKSANMSLKPEDMAMIAHQSAVESGSVPGKENSWGAGRVDALAGLFLALCTHRANGEPAYSITHQAGTPLTLEVDTVPNCQTMIVQLSGPFDGGTFYAGTSGPTGDASVSVAVPANAAGSVMRTQCLTVCSTGPDALDRVLRSNVIEIHFVP
jgi:hypothetical protein